MRAAMRGIAVLAIATLPFAGLAATQDSGLPPGTTAAPSPHERAAGWYEITVTVEPGKCLNQELGGQSRGIAEATAGRRGLIVHLEKANSIFAEPLVIAVADNRALSWSGRTRLRLGSVNGSVSGSLDGGFTPNYDRFDGSFEVRGLFCSARGRINAVRTTAPPPPPPPPPGPGASVFTDGDITPPPESPPASINSDGYITPVPEPPKPTPPSPLINGTYATTLTLRESRCITGEYRGSWTRNVELNPAPGITIPLPQYNSIFAAPITLMVEGLTVSQSTTIALNASYGGAVPAKFDGVFSNDGSRFEVQFEAGNPLCRLRGVISGVRL